MEEAELEDLGKTMPISLAQVNKLVKTSALARHQTQIIFHPEMLKAVDIVGLS